jgi:hypothetical protein
LAWVPAVTTGWLVGFTVAIALLGQAAGDPLVELVAGWGSAGLLMD